MNGGVCEARQAARDLGLADAGRPDHQDVLRRDLLAQGFADLRPPPAVAQAMATASLPLPWPTMCLSSSGTISCGVIWPWLSC